MTRIAVNHISTDDYTYNTHIVPIILALRVYVLFYRVGKYEMK